MTSTSLSENNRKRYAMKMDQIERLAPALEVSDFDHRIIDLTYELAEFLMEMIPDFQRSSHTSGSVEHTRQLAADAAEDNWRLSNDYLRIIVDDGGVPIALTNGQHRAKSRLRLGPDFEGVFLVGAQFVSSGGRESDVGDYIAMDRNRKRGLAPILKALGYKNSGHIGGAARAIISLTGKREFLIPEAAGSAATPGQVLNWLESECDMDLLQEGIRLGHAVRKRVGPATSITIVSSIHYIYSRAGLQDAIEEFWNQAMSRVDPHFDGEEWAPAVLLAQRVSDWERQKNSSPTAQVKWYTIVKAIRHHFDGKRIKQLRYAAGSDSQIPLIHPRLVEDWGGYKDVYHVGPFKDYEWEQSTLVAPLDEAEPHKVKLGRSSLRENKKALSSGGS